MEFTPLLGIGITLIAIGVIVLWRDMMRYRRLKTIENGPGHDQTVDDSAMADVKITHPEAPAQQEQFAHSAPVNSPLRDLRKTIDRVSAEIDEDGQPDGRRSDQTEREWAALRERVEQSVQSVNSVLRDVKISIGSAGQPGWSFSNRGYGNFRRVLLAKQSVAWLRLELTNDARFICALRSHGDEKSALNANETVTANVLTTDKISALIATSMQPITKYAARNQSKLISDQDVDQTIWMESEELVKNALERARVALRESGADLETAAAPEWNDMTKRHRLVTRVMLSQRHIAQMYIERPTAREIECLVVPTTGDAGKQSERQRGIYAKLSAPDFAEMIVNCAWPPIECAWNAAQRQKRANV